MKPRRHGQIAEVLSRVLMQAGKPIEHGTESQRTTSLDEVAIAIANDPAALVTRHCNNLMFGIIASELTDHSDDFLRQLCPGQIGMHRLHNGGYLALLTEEILAEALKIAGFAETVDTEVLMSALLDRQAKINGVDHDFAQIYLERLLEEIAIQALTTAAHQNRESIPQTFAEQFLGGAGYSIVGMEPFAVAADIKQLGTIGRSVFERASIDIGELGSYGFTETTECGRPKSGGFSTKAIEVAASYAVDKCGLSGQLSARALTSAVSAIVVGSIAFGENELEGVV